MLPFSGNFKTYQQQKTGLRRYLLLSTNTHPRKALKKVYCYHSPKTVKHINNETWKAWDKFIVINLYTFSKNLEILKISFLLPFSKHTKTYQQRITERLWDSVYCYHSPKQTWKIKYVYCYHSQITVKHIYNKAFPYQLILLTDMPWNKRTIYWCQTEKIMNVDCLLRIVLLISPNRLKRCASSKNFNLKDCN